MHIMKIQGLFRDLGRLREFSGDLGGDQVNSGASMTFQEVAGVAQVFSSSESF